MAKYNILISTTTFAKEDSSPLDLIKKADMDFKLNPYGRKLNKNEILSLASGMDGIIAGTESLHGEVLKQLNGLKVISRCGAGMDNVDIITAKELGIMVYNTPDAPTSAVAELTVSLMLDVLRRVSFMDREIRVGNWNKIMGNLLFKKKIGIIGFGKIGGKVAEILKGFGCEIAFTDPYITRNDTDAKNMSKEELLRWADIITLHISGLERVISKLELSLMKKDSLLINVARGGVIDEKALYETLKDGKIGGAALDVFEQEPYKGPLTELNNVVLTPHVGSYAIESRIEMERQAVENLIKGLEVQQ